MVSTSLTKNGGSVGGSDISGSADPTPQMPKVTLQAYIEARLRTEGEHRVIDAVKINDGSVKGAVQLAAALFGNLSGMRSEDFAISGRDLTHDRVEGLIRSYYLERGCEVRRGHEIHRSADLVAVSPGMVQDINLSVGWSGTKALITVFNPKKME